MSFLLDTDICSAHTKDNRVLFARFMQHAGQLHVSAITVGELSTWGNRDETRFGTSQEDNCPYYYADVTILEVTEAIAEEFGRLRAELLDRGQSDLHRRQDSIRSHRTVARFDRGNAQQLGTTTRCTTT